jgi:hypothetical protein
LGEVAAFGTETYRVPRRLMQERGLPRRIGQVFRDEEKLAATHDGPLQLPFGELPATGKRMDAPCCDVFELEDGKIKRFDCYPEGSVIFAQLGVLNNLDAALSTEKSCASPLEWT